MAFFEAYFDESGTPEGIPYTFVAGFVAKQSSWSAMGDQWQRVLNKFEVEACHASDLNTRNGEFSNWDDDKRNLFVNKLFSVIKSESGLKTIGIGVERGLFNKISSEFPDIPITPYMLCAEYCCIYVGGIAMRNKHWSPVAIYFEAGVKHNSPVFNHMTFLLRIEQFKIDHKIKSITWLRKEGVIPFQFADMFVYELFKLHKARAQHGADAKIRYPLQQFQKHVESNGRLLSEKEIREYYELYSDYLAAHGAKYR